MVLSAFSLDAYLSYIRGLGTDSSIANSPRTAAIGIANISSHTIILLNRGEFVVRR